MKKLSELTYLFFKQWCIVLLAAGIFLLSSCGKKQPNLPLEMPEPTKEELEIPTKTPEPTKEISKITDEPTPTPINTQKPTVEPTPTPINTQKPTVEPTLTPTNTQKPTVESTPTNTQKPTVEPTPTPINTPEPTIESTPTPTNTQKPTVEPTPTLTNIPEPTAELTPIPTPTPIEELLPPTKLPEPTKEETPSITPKPISIATGTIEKLTEEEIEELLQNGWQKTTSITNSYDILFWEGFDQTKIILYEQEVWICYQSTKQEGVAFYIGYLLGTTMQEQKQALISEGAEFLSVDTEEVEESYILWNEEGQYHAMILEVQYNKEWFQESLEESEPMVGVMQVIFAFSNEQTDDLEEAKLFYLVPR